MENQQPSISSLELGWLLGIIDGEGCIGIWKRGGKRTDYKPGVRLANTDRTLIDAYCNLLDRLNVGYYVTSYKARKKTQQPYWTVTVEGYKRIKTLLPHIKDALVAKREQAELVNEFINVRSFKYKSKEYGDVEFNIIDKICKLNYRGIRDEGSTTIRKE